ncbi:hypothetical protein CYMTET_29697 [Cymbomonas tetramitiformis]|uniref:Amidase domain-containing protein n=1 Tax=Cymbomonas tetramitiformis TaxID=36881 RepID=A0AAE0KUW7_9CHLO|nr:hypothetical protein CYMTET_29697 [Cymbomonas tetramitiformis]
MASGCSAYKAIVCRKEDAHVKALQGSWRSSSAVHGTRLRMLAPRNSRSVNRAVMIAANSIQDIVNSIRSGDRSASEITEEYLSNMESMEPTVQAFLSTNADAAREQAEAIDAAHAAGESLPPLAGVPIAVKDNIIVKETITSCGSRILEEYVAPYDSTCVAKLKQAGAVIVGKTNMDEFGMGSTTESSAFQITRNPWNPDRVPGGSSGGSAAAVSAGECVAALGSDTGGSIRQPASFCGVVGLKPTYGRVSRYGLVAYSSSLDAIGPISNCVEDAALVLQAIAGHDPADSTSADVAVGDYTSGLMAVDDMGSRPLEGQCIGLISQTMGEGVEASVREQVNAAAKHLESLGATIKEVSLPTFELGLPAYYVIAPSEASSNLSRYDGVRYGPG